MLGQVEFRHRMDLSRRLVPAIEQALGLAALAPAGLRGIAVSLGPGSFTGLRVGVATGKAIAWSLAIPVLGIPTLEALAAACSTPEGGLICALIPSGQAEIYAALYRAQHSERRVTRAPSRLAVGELVELLKAEVGPILLAGHAPAVELLAPALGERLTDAPARRRLPSAGVIAELGLRKLSAGQADDPETLAPLYLSLSTAEVRRQEWQNRRS
jgi:tRNA threonylcarbamoyladenosine biosynthesis protein TsaB